MVKLLAQERTLAIEEETAVSNVILEFASKNRAREQEVQTKHFDMDRKIHMTECAHKTCKRIGRARTEGAKIFRYLRATHLMGTGVVHDLMHAWWGSDIISASCPFRGEFVRKILMELSPSCDGSYVRRSTGGGI